MTDDVEPRRIAVPGPHVGATWAAAALATSSGGGLRLQLPVDPAGPLGLASTDRSLGRLTLPFGTAIDRRGRVYRLDRANGRVVRGDATALPGIGFEPNSESVAFAVDAGSLYLVDRGECRVYSLEGFALRDVWTFPADHGPLDVVASPGRVFFVAPRAVFDHRIGDARPRRLLPAKGEPPGGPWSRGAVDRDGLLYLLEESTSTLRVVDPDRPQRTFAPVVDPAAVRARFPAVPSIPGTPASVTRAYRTDTGDWIGQPLDSRIYRCRWDVAEVEFADLPAGTTATVQTFTADDDHDVANLPDAAWVDGLAVAGTNGDPAADPRVRIEFPVDGPPGRYLWLRIRLRGDGYATPSLAKIELRFPRRSYLEHLPAVFSEDERGRRFLERFLAIFQAEWDSLESRVDDIAGLFDPAAVPASHLAYLAGWFGIAFENGTSDDARRHLLERLPGVAFAPRGDDDRPGGPRRGTPAALRDYLAALLPSVGEAATSEPTGFPFVIEGFRERDFLALVEREAAVPLPAADDAGPVTGAAGPAARLFGPDAVGRLQLGGANPLGEAKLLPADRPDQDRFAEHAHRFRVVVPAAWVRTPAAEATLRRAIEAEKPAHTAYELDLVGPRFRIGVHSTVGVDTILAGPEPLRLGRANPNAVLGSAGDEGPPGAGPLRLHSASRLGQDAGRL